MVRYGTSIENGREEPWAEDDDFTHAGDSFTVRITALYPYKDYANSGDELFCHIDFMNITQGTSGRYDSIWVEARNFGEAGGHLRRHSTYRTLVVLLNTQTPDPSPVFP